MLDSNTILGIRAYLDCEEYKHGLLTQNIAAWPCGTPIVYPVSNLDMEGRHRPNTRIYTLMPPCQSGGSIETAQVNIQSISPVGLKPLYKNHKVLVVNEFEINKFNRLLEFIRDVGGISIIVEYDGGRKKLAKSIAKLEKLFRYTSLFYYGTWSDKFLWDENDKFVCILTFLDLPYCVPLFNMNKVDGVGLSFSGATIRASKEYGHLHRTFKADFIYSNYEDNVFFVDGIAINSIRPPDSSVYKELDKYASKHLEIGRPDKRKESNRHYSNDAKYKLEAGESVTKWTTEPAEMAEDEAPEPSNELVSPTLENIYNTGGVVINHNTLNGLEVTQHSPHDEIPISQQTIQTIGGGTGQYITTDNNVWELNGGPDPATNDEPEEEGG